MSNLESIVPPVELCKRIPVGELETIKGALHECGDVQEFNVCETCAEWIEENAGRKVEK